MEPHKWETDMQLECTNVQASFVVSAACAETAETATLRGQHQHVLTHTKLLQAIGATTPAFTAVCAFLIQGRIETLMVSGVSPPHIAAAC